MWHAKSISELSVIVFKRERNIYKLYKEDKVIYINLIPRWWEENISFYRELFEQ